MMLHTKYQGSRPYGFRQEDFFMFPYISLYVNHVTPRAGRYWPKGHNLNNLGRGPLGDATCQMGIDLIIDNYNLIMKFLSLPKTLNS